MTDAITDIQQDEWMAWRSFCHHFTEITGMDINHDRCKPMVDAARRWGEELVVLRKRHQLSPVELHQTRAAAPFHPNTKKGTE